MRRDDPASHADVFLLPLAVAEPERVSSAGIDPWVLARRIPDFLHQLLNDGQLGPTGMVEIQSPADEKPVGWAMLHEVPDADDAFDLIPEGESARAVMVGSLACPDGALAVQLRVYFADDVGAEVSSAVAGLIPLDDPVPALRRMAERVARLLDLAAPTPAPGLLTHHGDAFFAYLSGLDGAAVLSGDLDVQTGVEPKALLQPLVEAVRLDPAFGLALRTLHSAALVAVEAGELDAACGIAVVDQCLAALPRDGEGCVAIAEHLATNGDHPRAVLWLQHAVRLEPPPPRGLESLGIVMANRGDTGAARRLWLKGLEQDGHPDFFAHLARLSFAHGDDQDAWEKVMHGLRRIRDRASRPTEWDDDGRGSGVLLSYLTEHLGERRPTRVVLATLRELCGLLSDCEDRVALGLCLLELGKRAEAEAELRAGLAGELEPSTRDRALRGILRLRVRGFERRFSKAVDAVMRRRVPRAALAELQRIQASEPGYWPATYYAGVAQRRLGREETALDLMADVLRCRPGQPDALVEMAYLFDRRGNPKRALECIDDALAARPADPHLLGRRALYQHRLGRAVQARESLHAALQRGEADPELEEIRRLILRA